MRSHTHGQVAHRIRNAERFGAYLFPSGKERHRQARNLVFCHGSLRRLRDRYQAHSFNLHSVPLLIRAPGAIRRPHARLCGGRFRR